MSAGTIGTRRLSPGTPRRGPGDSRFHYLTGAVVAAQARAARIPLSTLMSRLSGLYSNLIIAWSTT